MHDTGGRKKTLSDINCMLELETSCHDEHGNKEDSSKNQKSKSFDQKQMNEKMKQGKNSGKDFRLKNEGRYENTDRRNSTQCWYAEECYREDCWFRHPEGHIPQKRSLKKKRKERSNQQPRTEPKSPETPNKMEALKKENHPSRKAGNDMMRAKCWHGSKCLMNKEGTCKFEHSKEDEKRSRNKQDPFLEEVVAKAVERIMLLTRPSRPQQRKQQWKAWY